MTDQYSLEPMLEIFIFETTQLVGQLEQLILEAEKSGCNTPPLVHEIFRIMHTIKGSASMMLFNNIADLTHALEDLFFSCGNRTPGRWTAVNFRI